MCAATFLNNLRRAFLSALFAVFSFELLAAALKLHPENFPWQKSIFHFARTLGNVHQGNIDAAEKEIAIMYALHDTLKNKKDDYKVNQLMIQIKTGEAWVHFANGKREEAIELMRTASYLEDKTEKSPVTPGEILPAMELLADMLLAAGRNDEALIAYEADLKNHPERFNGLYGAAVAAERSDNAEKAIYYNQRMIIMPKFSRSK
jgi:tetratricopeptide (TPR) repeat protein